MNDIETTYQTAMAEHRAGRLDVAERLYRQVLDRNRFFARAWHLLGVLLHQKGDTATAIEYLERAIGLEPQWAVFYANLGSIYLAAYRLREAEQVLSRAIDLAPHNPVALTSLARVWCDQNRCDEAIGLFRRALDVNPNEPTTLAGLGYAYSELGLVEESIAAYRSASELSRDLAYRILAATQLPLVYESQADVLRWRQRLMDGIDALLADGVQADLETRHATPVFSLPHQGLNDVEIQRKIAKLYRSPPLPPGVWQPRTDDKIRVGFISSFFHTHTVGKLARGLITRLSRDDFHVTVFSVGQHDDPIARELAAAADRYVLLPHDLRLARQSILAHSVDILFYTDIGMDPTTYSLAFSRLAPVQCVTWGHSETTGLETIDYFLSSEQFEVPGADAHYSERLIRLPSLTFYYHRAQLPPQLEDRAAFGLDPAAHLYACPQSIYKFHPDFDPALAAILRRDPAGKVVLIQWAYSQSDDLLRRRFAATMPDVADRIIFIRRLQQPQFMNFLTLVDVLLDPFPYGGCTSTLEAFSFGAPVVTLPTELLRGRFTQAYCRRLGVEECIARDEEDYVEIAVRMGTDSAFRRQMSERIIASQRQLFEDDSTVRELEAFFRTVAGGK
jgi:protein O-GlcNAc transferase